MSISRYLFVNLVTLSSLSFFATEIDAQAAVDTVEEIIVTARKRSESAADVPIAISVITATDLDDTANVGVIDIDELIPNISYNVNPTNNGSAQVGIRGIGSENYDVVQDPKIAVYVDDAYISRPQGNLFEMWDMDRIEVLRGPQGTLFGRNTTAGAVQLVHNKPNLESFSGAIRLGLGERNYNEHAVMINLPLSEKAALRVSSIARDQDGYIRNTINNEMTGSTNVDVIRAALAVEPIENLSLNFTYAKSDRDELRLLGACTWISGSYGYPAIPQLGFLYQAVGQLQGIIDNCNSAVPGVSASEDNPMDNQVLNQRYTMNLDYETAAGTFSIIHSKTDMDSLSGSWGLGLSGFGAHYLDTPDSLFQSDYESTEYKFVTNINGNIDLVVGYFDFKEDSTSRVDIEQFHDWTPTIQDLMTDCSALFGLPAGALSCGAGMVGVKAGQSTRGRFTTNNLSDAYFFEASIALTEQLNLSVGYRNTDESKEATARYTTMPLGPTEASIFELPVGAEFPFGLVLPAQGSVAQCEHTLINNICNAANDFSQSTPRITADYTFDNGNMIYASYAEGFASGGFNANVKLQQYEPEFSENIEFGFKGSIGKVKLNAAYFLMEYQNQQIITALIEGNVPVLRVVGVQQVDLDGIELEASYSISDHLFVNVFYGDFNGEYGEYILPDGTDLTSLNYDGFGPQYNSGISLVHSASNKFGELNSVLTYTKKGSDYFHTSQEPFTQSDPYSLLNFTSTLSVGDDLDITLYGKNLTDELYINGGYGDAASAGFFTMYYGAPREGGIKITKRF